MDIRSGTPRSRTELIDIVTDWLAAWSRHDLPGVLALMSPDAFFESWNGAAVRGRGELERAWRRWFDDDPDFQFTTEEMFADAQAQKVLLRWTLQWKSPEPAHRGRQEVRRGVDVIHIDNGLIAATYCYSRSTVIIDGRRVRLSS